jgi:DNA (cytosine-5)-methyltransferase 1
MENGKANVTEFMCGAGGATMGYLQAGCDVIGVDIDPACGRHYPKAARFIHHDVFTVEQMLDWPQILEWTDLLHAGPECEGNSVATKIRGDQSIHEDQIGRVRDMFERFGKPYVIENVPQAESEHHRMRNDLELCGYEFGRTIPGPKYRLERHRIFEIHGFTVPQPVHVPHSEIPAEERQVTSVFGRLVSSKRKGGHEKYLVAKYWRPIQMGIDHIPVNAGSSKHAITGKTYNLLALAIPPAYTRYIAEYFIKSKVTN